MIRPPDPAIATPTLRYMAIDSAEATRRPAAHALLGVLPAGHELPAAGSLRGERLRTRCPRGPHEGAGGDGARGWP